jgi:hypothetical protein
LTAAQRQAGEEILIDSGIPKLEMEMSAVYNKRAKDFTEGGQLALQLEEAPPAAEADLFQEVGHTASTDYYYAYLQKSGVIKGDNVATAQAAPVAPATPAPAPEQAPALRRGRARYADPSRVGVYSLGTIMLMPVQ